MTQPTRAATRRVATTLQNASRGALVMAAISLLLVGADAAVAVSRHAGSPHSGATAATAVTSPTTSTEPGIAVTPTSPATIGRGPAKTDPRALLARAFADALAQGSVHAVARNVSKKTGTAIFDDYDAKTGGIQHISIYGGRVTVRVVGPRTYFTGDKRGLTRYMGFTPDEVAALHHQWLRLVAAQAGYKAVTAGVTLASTLREDRVGAPLRLLPQRTVDGVRAVGVRGRAVGDGAPRHAIATMWISTGNHPLPVEYVARYRRVRLTQTFSDWGKAVPLAAPAKVFGQKTSEA